MMNVTYKRFKHKFQYGEYMIKQARIKYPNYTFTVDDSHIFMGDIPVMVWGRPTEDMLKKDFSWEKIDTMMEYLFSLIDIQVYC